MLNAICSRKMKQEITMNKEFERLKVLMAGIFSLILLLGIARFAYTPLLPIMQDQAGLDFSEGGWLAAINYLGYLSGALFASMISDLKLKDRLYRIGLLVAILTTVGMGLTEHFFLWSLFRFFAGLSSAAGLLLGSGLILNWLIRHEYRSELGIHFAGVGLGIVFCSLSVDLLSDTLNWREQWFALTAFGILLFFPSWFWLPKPTGSNMTQSGETLVDSPPSQSFLKTFMLAYFCAGVGYVVSATFIVAIIDQSAEFKGNGALAFLILGLAAAPACIIWDQIARRVGDLNALIIAFVLKIIGMLMMLADQNIIIVMLGAALFGGTFIGIVSLVLTMAGRYYPTKPAKMMGKMTISYGVAQVFAPAMTGMLASLSGNYLYGLYSAIAFMVIGTLLMFRLKFIDS